MIDEKINNKLNEYFTLDDKIYPYETGILIFMAILVIGASAALGYFYYKKEFIYKPYSRTEGPSYTVRSTETRKQKK